MNQPRFLLISGALAAVLIPAGLAQTRRLPTSGGNNPWTMEDSEIMNRSFPIGAGGKLTMDLAEGYIHIAGYDGPDVRVTVERKTTAKSGDALARSHTEVNLEMAQFGNGVRLYANGPFRQKGHNDNNDNYRVAFNCDVQVPRSALLELKSMNSGIQVKDVNGDFEINGLNGAIEMTGIGGSGSAKTLNGKVSVAFVRNPARDTQFNSLNGSIDVYFQPPVNAQLKYHTLNGGVWADFDVQTDGVASGRLSGATPEGGSGSGRAGSGGPTLSFDTLNGSIRLHTSQP